MLRESLLFWDPARELTPAVWRVPTGPSCFASLGRLDPTLRMGATGSRPERALLAEPSTRGPGTWTGRVGASWLGGRQVGWSPRGPVQTHMPIPGGTNPSSFTAELTPKGLPSTWGWGAGPAQTLPAPVGRGIGTPVGPTRATCAVGAIGQQSLSEASRGGGIREGCVEEGHLSRV